MGHWAFARARTIGALGLALCLSACGLLEKAEQPASPAVSDPAAASDAWPSTPVPAFRPALEGACPAGYALTQTTCVHGAYRARVGASELAQQIAAYRAGAASPRVGGGPASAQPAEEVAQGDANDPSKLPPDAFTKKRTDADKAKAARLRELETLIRNARIRAGEKVDPEPSGDADALVAAGGIDMMNPQKQIGAKRNEDAAKLSEMTQGMPPDVLKAVLVEIQRNGGTAMVSLEELQALEAQVKSDSASTK